MLYFCSVLCFYGQSAQRAYFVFIIKSKYQHLPHSSHDIDLTRIGNKHIVSFIHENRLYSLHDFAELKSFCRKSQDTNSFHRHVKVFHINHPVEQVWQAYKTTPPRQAWCGKMLQFGLQYCRRRNKLAYMDDEYQKAEVGHIVFIRVKVLGGLANIAVGHEITAIDDKQNYLETSYLLKGKSAGSQQIQLSAGKNGGTEITHRTIYKSGSYFRDKFLYPFLHTKAIREFHNNIRNQLG